MMGSEDVLFIKATLQDYLHIRTPHRRHHLFPRTVRIAYLEDPVQPTHAGSPYHRLCIWGHRPFSPYTPQSCFP